MRAKVAQIISRAAAIAGGSRRNDRRGLAVGLAALAALVAADVAFGDEVILAGSYVAVPFLAALWAGPAITAGMAVGTLAALALSGLWNLNFGAQDYDLPLILGAVVGTLAIASAWAREQARRGTRRLELLDDVGAVADGSLPLDQTLARVVEVMVPAFADICMVDAIHEGRVIRSGARVAGRSDAQAIERHLAGRRPSLPAWMTTPNAPFPRHPRFIPRFNDEITRRLAHDPADLEWLRSLGLRSTITVAMLARDRMLGAVTFITAWSGRRYTVNDVRFGQALAGRVALALDNAGLFSDLESVERRMDNVMSLLDEGVVIHDADGELVFGNPAAGRLLGTGEEGPPTTERVRSLLQVRTEDGTPQPAEELLGRRALHGGSAEPQVLRVTDRRGGTERWLMVRAKPIMGPDGRALYSVGAIGDVTAVKRAEFAQRLLARVGELLATTTDYRRMLGGIADLVVPALAEWCAVNVPGEDGVIEQMAIAHVDPERREWGRQVARRYPSRVDDEAGLAEVLRSGAAQLVAMPDEFLRRVAADAEHERLLGEADLRSLILVPMLHAGTTVGVLTLGNGQNGRAFDQQDLELAAEIARRAGTAVENARLATERGEVARVLQEGLMPLALPHMSGWETAAMYQPAGEVNAVGGDFYDAFEIEGGWMITVGDVVGRGAAAASLTALARHTIRTAGTLTGDPCVALDMLDEALRARGETALCTAAVLILPDSDTEPVEVSVVSAGHPLPLLLSGGDVTEAGRPGPLLGAFEASSWTPQVVTLDVGDQIVLFTDGVIEAEGEVDRFGEHRLHSVLARAERPLQAVGAVTAALEDFIGGEPKDDVALVAVRRSRLRSRSASGIAGPGATAVRPSPAA